LRINESVIQDLNGLEEEFRNQALKELWYAIRIAEKKNTGYNGEPVVHINPRRFHFYGRIGVLHPGAYEGGHRIRLEAVCWIISDNNVPQNEIYVMIE
jgi:hypothetical protein